MKPLSTWQVMLLIILLPFTAIVQAAEPQALSLWRNPQQKERIVAFVTKVTDSHSPEYVAPADRIAVFDNDGTLWSEKPTYTQLTFSFDQVRQQAPAHPAWQTTPPYQWLLDGKLTSLFEHGWKALIPIMAQAQADITPAQYRQRVLDWLAQARSPRFNRPYTELVYQPMIELLDYLQAHDFTVYIVTGAGSAFVQPWSQAIYHIPPQQVIGTTFGYEYQVIDGEAVLHKTAKLVSVNDGKQKPINIAMQIGKRPIMAVGNSTGDLPMLAWTAAQPRPYLNILVHHTDAKREWAYDSQTFEGKFTPELMQQAKARNWMVVDMQQDWQRIFPTAAEVRTL